MGPTIQNTGSTYARLAWPAHLRKLFFLDPKPFFESKEKLDDFVLILINSTCVTERMFSSALLYGNSSEPINVIKGI